MIDAQLVQEVRVRHTAGQSPKQISRALGLRPAVVVPIVRQMAGLRAAEAQEAAVCGCWVSPGWSEGLTVDQDHDWPEGPGQPAGLVSVVVARGHRHGKVSVCGYLVDVYCLGVKDVLGPRMMSEQELSEFVRRYFNAYQGASLPAPIELARQLVLGAVEYAGSLGFEPHRDFEQARGHLGKLSEPLGIRFGHAGQPLFVQGPHDDAATVIRKLEASVGSGNFHFTITQPLASGSR